MVHKTVLFIPPRPVLSPTEGAAGAQYGRWGTNNIAPCPIYQPPRRLRQRGTAGLDKGGKVPQRALTCRPGRRGGHSKDLAVYPTEGPEMAYVHLRMPNPERIQAVREEQDV